MAQEEHIINDLGQFWSSDRLKKEIIRKRTKLAGTGIMCGLEFYMDSYCHINLIEGCGITSSGQVLCYPDSEFRYYSVYIEPGIDDDDFDVLQDKLKGAHNYFYNRSGEQKNERGRLRQPRITKKFVLFRLHESRNGDPNRKPLTPQSIPGDTGESGCLIKEGPDGTNDYFITDLDQWVLILYLEQEYPECTIVPLLIHQDDAFNMLRISGELKEQCAIVTQEDEPIGIGSLFPIEEQHSEGERFNAYHKHLLLKNIRMRRFGYGSIDKLALVGEIYPDLPEAPTDFLRIFNEYKVLINKAFDELSDGLDALHDYFYELLGKRQVEGVIRYRALLSTRLGDYFRRSENEVKKIRQLALGTGNQWVLLMEDWEENYSSSNISRELKNVLKQFRDKGKGIRHLSIGDRGRYVLIPEGDEEILFSESLSADFKDKLLELVDGGILIQQIVLGLDEEFVILTNETSWHRYGETVSDPLKLELDSFIVNGRKIKYLSISSDPDPKYIILIEEADGSWDYIPSTNISKGLILKLDELKRAGTRVLQIELGPNDFYFILTDKVSNVWYSHHFPKELKERIDSLIRTGHFSIQYIYAHIKDLVETYNELQAEIREFNRIKCCPTESQFPKHLFLGKPKEEVSFQLSIFRHYPKQPPVFNDNADRLQKIKLLHWRLAVMVQNFSIPDPDFDISIEFDSPADDPYMDVLRERENTLPDTYENMPIKITPSRSPVEPLGRQAIPFYYHLSRSYYSLQHYWAYEMTKGNKENHHFSYHASHQSESYTQLEEVVQPFAFNVEDYPFYRIEGHIGKNLYPSVDSEGNFQKGVLWTILHKRNVYNLSFDLIGMPLSKLVKLFDHLLYEKQAFSSKEVEFETILDQEMISLLEKRGLEHQGGVPKGGTLVLVHEENSDKRVVADFSLPYYCCKPDKSQIDDQPPLIEVTAQVIDCLPNETGKSGLEGVTIQIADRTFGPTDPTGVFQLTLLPGIYPVKVQKPGYQLKEPAFIEIFESHREPTEGEFPKQDITIVMQSLTADVLLSLILESDIHPEREALDIQLKNTGESVIKDGEMGVDGEFNLLLPIGEQTIEVLFLDYPGRSFDLKLKVNSCTKMKYTIHLDDTLSPVMIDTDIEEGE